MAALGNALAGDDMRRYVSKGAMQDKLRAADAARGLLGGGALMTDAHDESARQDWENRIGTRSGVAFGGNAPRLDPPKDLEALSGAHQVTLTWSPVAGAIGYQVYAAPTADGPWEPVDHAGRDVLAVPHPPYADTTGDAGGDPVVRGDLAVRRARRGRARARPSRRPRWPGRPRPSPSRSTRPTTLGDAAPAVAADDRQRAPLAHAARPTPTGGRVIGEELTSALKAAHDELGVSHVRAHAILGDDLGVYREVDGEPVHDFAGVDRVYDHLRSIGLYPVVELSFMPHDLASDPAKTVFDYAAIVSPPQGLGPLARPDPRPGRAPGRPLRPRGPGRALVVRGLERGQPRGLLVGHARGVPAALRRDRRPPSVRSTTACASAARRRRRPAGSRSCSRTPSASGSPVDFVSDAHLRQPAAGLPADAGAVRPRGHADLVDRVGRHPDALQRGQRRGVRGDLPAARDGRLGRTDRDRGAVLLGGLRPLRGARPPAAPCCTAASAPAPSASCASRAGGRWPCSSGWSATGSASR